MEDEVIDQFTQGVNAYWSGDIPEFWDHPETRAKSPYLTGWYMASMWEVQTGWITDNVGDPLQDEDDY